MSEFINRIPDTDLSRIRLVALDLDGTLFNDQGKVTPASIEAINRLLAKGVHVVISTGRPLSGVPYAQLTGTSIDYALTTNGAAVYRIHDKACIYENPLDDGTALSLLAWLQTKKVHIAAFINGEGITPAYCQQYVPNLIVPESVKETYRATRLHVPDLIQEIKDKHYHVHKITLNFPQADDGILYDRQETADYLASREDLEVVCGGFQNIEMTRAGVDKGVGLQKLAEFLGIAMDQTMAVGDTENDIPILKAAGVAVAMGNAIDEMKELADIVTYSNNEDGVAHILNMI